MDASTIIDNLGGTSKVAELCEVTTGAVSQWRTDGIPRAREQYLRLLNPQAFGISAKKSTRNATKKAA